MTLGLALGKVAGSLWAASTADLLLYPDKYVNQFSDMDSAPVEQPADYEVISEPVEYADGTPYEEVPVVEEFSFAAAVSPMIARFMQVKEDIVASMVAEAEAGMNAEQLIEAGHDISYALFFGADLAACQALMAKEIFIGKESRQSTPDDFARYLKGGDKADFTVSASQSNPLLHGYDQFLGNGMASFQFALYGMANMTMNEGIEKVENRIGCALGYGNILNERGMLSNEMKTKLRSLKPGLQKFYQYAKDNNALSAQGFKKLEDLLRLIETL